MLMIVLLCTRRNLYLFIFDKNGYVYIKIRKEKKEKLQPFDFLEKSYLRGQPHLLQTRLYHPLDKRAVEIKKSFIRWKIDGYKKIYRHHILT